MTNCWRQLTRSNSKAITLHSLRTWIPKELSIGSAVIRFWQTEAEEMSRSAGMADQNEKLLDCLLRKPDIAFEILGDALRRTRHFFLEQLLACEVYT